MIREIEQERVRFTEGSVKVCECVEVGEMLLMVVVVVSCHFIISLLAANPITLPILSILEDSLIDSTGVQHCCGNCAKRLIDTRLAL